MHFPKSTIRPLTASPAYCLPPLLVQVGRPRGSSGGFPGDCRQRRGCRSRPHAPHQAQARLGGDGLHHPGQGRVHEPRPVGEGPGRPAHDPGGREARRAQAGRAGGGGHCRQHRHRPRAGCQCTRLSHRSSSSPTPRARRRRTRCACSAPSWSRCRPSPTPTPTTTSTSAAGSPTSCASASPTACCSPTSGTTSTTARRTTSPRARRSGSRPGGKVDGFICSIGTGGTVAGVSAFLREKKQDIVIGVADPRGAAMYHLFKDGEAKAHRGRLDHRGHRARPRHPDHRRTQGGQGLPDRGQRGRAPHLRSPGARGPLPRRLVGHQRGGRDPAGEGARARPHHRHGAGRLRHALPVQAVQPGVPALQEPAGAGRGWSARRISPCRS